MMHSSFASASSPLYAFTLVLAVVLLACGAPAEKAEEKPAPAERRYPLRGEVVGIDAEKGALRIAHEEIPGYMAAMTMRFPVLDRQVLGQVEEGDEVTATLVVAPDNRYWLVELEVVGEAVAEPDEATPEPEEETQAPEGGEGG